MAVLKDLIVHGASRFLNGINTDSIHANLIDANDGVFKTITTTTLDAETITTEMLKATNARVSQTLTVDGTISTNKWEAANIANIGGNFYISPTGKSDSGTITITKTGTTTINGVVIGVYTLVIGSASFGVTSTSSTIWGSTSGNQSRVILTGSISYNNSKKFPLGTCNGTMTTLSTGTNTLTGFTITGVTSAALDVFFEEVGIASVSSTACNGYELQISVYQTYSDSKLRPVGILLTSYGKEKRQYIDIYGGTNVLGDTASGFADPEVRIGQLDGLPALYTGQSPSGWGIYTTNGFFKGKIVATLGKIGDGTAAWTIGNDGNNRAYIYSGITNITSSGSTTGTYVGTNGISNYQSASQYVNLSGGKITAQGADITGVIKATSGIIGNSASNKITIGSNTTNASIYSGSHSALTSTVDGFYIGADGLSIGSKFSVTNTGKLTASDITINSGSIASTVTIGGKNQSEYLNSNIEVGGRNLLLGTVSPVTWTVSLNSSNYAVKDCYKTYSPVPSIFVVDDLVTISFDWSTTATSGSFHLECGTVTPYVWGTVVEAVGTRNTTSNYVDISSSNTSGHCRITFKITSAVTSAANTLQWMRIRVDGADTSGKTFTISNAKAERGNKATDWTPAPEDVQAEIDTRKSIHTLTSSSSGSTYANILSWSTEGRTNSSWGINTSVTPLTNVKIGDTCRVAYKATDMGENGTIVYVIGELTSISDNTIYMTMHGLDTTVIDGGHILTGTIDANKVNISNLTVGAAQSGWGNVLNSNINVGGRNLARGTAIMAKGNGNWNTGTWRDSGASSTYNYTVNDSPVPSVNKGILVTTATANTRYGVAQDVCPMLNKQITFSVWAKGTSGGTITLQSVWWNGISVSNWSKAFTANGNWQYLSFTTDLTNVTIPNNACSICYMYWTGVNANDSCIFIAPKLEYGNVATDWSTALEDLEVGAKNLLLGTSSEEVSFTSTVKDYNLSSSIVDIKDNDFITISFWAKASASLWTDFYFNDGSSSWASTAYFYPAFQLTTSWQYFTYTGVASAKASTAKVLRFRQNSTEHGGASSVGTVYVKKLKLEKGTVATEWNSASDCITEISNTGIWITPPNKRPTSTGDVVANSTTGTLINTDGVGIYNAGVKIAQYGSNALIGREESGYYNVLIDATGGISLRKYQTALAVFNTNNIIFYDGVGTATANIAAQIGSSGISIKKGDIKLGSKTSATDVTNSGTYIDSSGNIATSSLKAHGGTIGGWTINEDSLSRESIEDQVYIELNSSGLLLETYVENIGYISQYGAGSLRLGTRDSTTDIYSAGYTIQASNYGLEIGSGIISLIRDDGASIIKSRTYSSSASAYCQSIAGSGTVSMLSQPSSGGYVGIHHEGLYWILSSHYSNRVTTVHGGEVDLNSTTADRRVRLLANQNGVPVFVPSVNGSIYLGTDGLRWYRVYCTLGAFNSSDLKEKSIINSFDWKVDDFIRGLRPIAYNRIQEDGTKSNRIELGFGAQDVAKLSKDLNIGDLQLYEAAIIEKDENGEKIEKPYHGEDIDDSKLTWSLSYTEFIAPMVLEIQRLMDRIDKLEKTLKNIKPNVFIDNSFYD